MNQHEAREHTNTRPLTEDERGWVDQNWTISSGLGLTKDSSALTRGYQLTRSSWELTPAEQRPPAEHAVVGLGALAGQFICNFTDFEWGVRGEGNKAQWVLVNPDGAIVEPMQRMAEIWSGSLEKTVGGFVDEVLEGYSGER